ncbi:hypothetical protein ACTFIW_005990 [Dictyostelium discoideum]
MREIFICFLFLIISFNGINSKVPCLTNYTLEYSRNYKGNYGVLYNCLDPERGNSGYPLQVINRYTNFFKDKNNQSYYFPNSGYIIYNFYPTYQTNCSQFFSIESKFQDSIHPNSSLMIQPSLYDYDVFSYNITSVDSKYCTSLKYDQCVIFIEYEGRTEPLFLFDLNTYRPSLIYGNPTNGTYYFELSKISSLKSSYNFYLFNSSNKYEPIHSFNQINYKGLEVDSKFSIFKNQFISITINCPVNIGSFTVQNVNFDSEIPPSFPYSELGVAVIVFPFSIYYSGVSQPFSFTNYPGSIAFLLDPPKLFDLDNANIHRIDFFETVENIILRVNAYDIGGSGIKHIIITFYSGYCIETSINSIKMSNMDLVQGDCINGTYQTSMPKYSIRKHFSIEIIDHANNSNTTKGVTPFILLDPTDIKNISFAKNNVNVSDNSVANTMYVTLTNTTMDNFVFQFIPIFGVKNEPSFTSRWDSTTKRYEIEFIIPSGLSSGPIQYMLNPVGIDSSTFFSYLGSSSELKVVCEKTDTIGPLVTQIFQKNGTIKFYGESIEVGYDIHFEDKVNGIAFINLAIGSNKYRRDMDFNCTPPQILNNYNCSIRWNVSVPQTFFISKMSTIDSKGYLTEYPNVYKVNPLMNIIENDSYQIVVLSDVHSDVNPPTLKTIETLRHNITNKSYRTISVKFTISDDQTGVLIEPPPSIYTISETANILSFSCICTDNIQPNITYNVANFYCEIIVPYLYGYPNGFSLQIHGVYDNDLNVAGFKLEKSNSNNFFINISSSGDLPVIESFKTYESSITLYGTKFGISPTVFYSSNFEKEYKIFTPTPFLNNTYIQFSPNLSQLTKGENLSIYIETSFGKSNIISMYVPCHGQPLCGGSMRGSCTLNGCVCFPKFMGPDCSSDIISVDPNINTTNPEVQWPYEQVQSLVSVNGLREVDFNGKLVNEYVFNSWNYYKTNDSYTYLTNVTNKNDPSKNTKVEVLIKHFRNGGVVEFAGNDISILPGAIKYYITIYNYQFKTKLNTLQLMMYASIKTHQTGNVCSNDEFGNIKSVDDESQYLKLKINDITLYGQFIKRAILDGDIIAILNKQIDSLNNGKNGTYSEIIIAIEIPYYQAKAELDPNFSILLENGKTTPENSICIGKSVKPGLSKSQIIGIIVACVGMFIVLGIVICSTLYKKSTLFRIKAKFITLKLKSIKGK